MTAVTVATKVAPAKRVAVDFDGTLCGFAFPNIGPVKKDAREALLMFKALGFKIIIWSCRTCHWDYDVYGGDPQQPTLERDRVKEMIEWLNANEIPYDEVDDGSKGKPSADYYIDDKGVRFDDNWDEIMAFIFSRENGVKLTPKQISVLNEIAEANGFIINMSSLKKLISLEPEK